MTMRLGDATISQGAVSDDVKNAQRLLTALGYDVGPIDGIFGQNTLYATMAFQTTHGLVSDGIIGPQTWAALRQYSSIPPPVSAAQAPTYSPDVQFVPVSPYVPPSQMVTPAAPAPVPMRIVARPTTPGIIPRAYTPSATGGFSLTGNMPLVILGGVLLLAFAFTGGRR